MPITETEAPRIPRSALRYRSVMSTPPVSSPGQTAPHAIPPRRTALQARASTRVDIGEESRWTTDEEKARGKGTRKQGRGHWLVVAGGTLSIMLLGWVSLSALASWWQITLDDWHFGRPRTFQIDQVVGHHDSPLHPSHFIALNLHRHILVIELPAGDPSRSVVFSGPTLLGPGQDLTPVTLSFRDVNHDGSPDMLLSVQDSLLVFLNRNGSFSPPAAPTTWAREHPALPGLVEHTPVKTPSRPFYFWG